MLWSLQMTFNTRYQYHWPQIYTQNVQMMHTVRAMSALRAKLLMTPFQFLNSGNKSFMIYFFHRWFQTEFHIPPIHMELCYICLSHIQLRARYDFLAPVRFPVRKSEAPVPSLWSHQSTGPIQLDLAPHLYFWQINRRTPQGSSVAPAGASYGPRAGLFDFSVCSIPHGLRTGPVWDP